MSFTAPDVLWALLLIPLLIATYVTVRAGVPSRRQHAARAAAGSDQVIPQMSFTAPDVLWALLLIPLLIATYVFATRRKNRRGMRFTNTSMLDVVVPKQSQ